MKTLFAGLAGIALMIGASTANAVNCAVSDVTFRGNNADACSGPTGGNDDASAVELAFGGDWFRLAKDNTDPQDTDESNTFFGVKWELVSDTGNASQGSYSLKWTSVGTPGLPLTMDLVIAIKGGSEGFSLFKFNQENFLVNPNTGTGTYKITFTTGNNNSIPGLSHITAYGGNEKRYCAPTDPECNTIVPEPGSLALLGLGLMGLGLGRRRLRA